MDVYPPGYHPEERHPGALLARQFRERLPNYWSEESDAPRHWRFIDLESDPDNRRTYIEVDARDHMVPVLTSMEGKNVGPSVTAHCAGSQIMVILPATSDFGAIKATVEAVAKVCRTLLVEPGTRSDGDPR
ncbi:hypothetical protein ACWDUL_38405 [Nocardia niigatensis]